jgi:hypothetical protein
MDFINSISPTELSILANVVALALAEDKTTDEINVLGNFIVGVGGLLLTIAAQQQSLQAIQDKQQQLQDLKKQIKQLEKDLAK